MSPGIRDEIRSLSEWYARGVREGAVDFLERVFPFYPPTRVGFLDDRSVLYRFRRQDDGSYKGKATPTFLSEPGPYISGPVELATHPTDIKDGANVMLRDGRHAVVRHNLDLPSLTGMYFDIAAAVGRVMMPRRV